MKALNSKREKLPPALRKIVRYNGKVMRSKDFIDLLIDDLAYNIVVIIPRKSPAFDVYSLRNGSMKHTFETITEMRYIDSKLKSKPDSIYTNLIEIDKIIPLNSQPGARNILATTTVSTTIPKKELGGPVSEVASVQDVKQGKILEGPPHEGGGIKIKVGDNTVAEAEGNEIVINGAASKKHCELLSEINQSAGNGVAFDCSKCDHEKEIIAKKGAQLPSEEYEFFYKIVKDIFGEKLDSFKESVELQSTYVGKRVFIVVPNDKLSMDAAKKDMEDIELRIVQNIKDIGIADPGDVEFIPYQNNEFLILLNKAADPNIYMRKGGKICPVGTEIQSLVFYKTVFDTPEKTKEWAKTNGFSHDYVDDTEHTYRIRQVDPDIFDEGSFRALQMTDGIYAVIGCPKEKSLNHNDPKVAAEGINLQNDNGDHLEEPIDSDHDIDGIQYFDEGGQILEKVTEALRNKEKTKEFKDTDIVSYTRKYGAAYDLVTSGDLDKIEKDNVTAYKLIEKGKIWELYSAPTLKEEGNTSGAAYLKVKVREALSSRPMDAKEAREVYVKNIEKLRFLLSTARKVAQVKDVLLNFIELKTFDFGIIPDDITKQARYGHPKELIYFEEIFGKKFYNFCRFSSDSAKKILIEAHLYEEFTPEMRSLTIELRKKELQKRIDKANGILEQVKNIDPMNIDKIKETVRSGDELYYGAYDKPTVISYYTRSLQGNTESFDKIESSLSKVFTVRENDWSWADPKSKKADDETTATAEEKEATGPVSILQKYGIMEWRKDAKRTPLDFIKRTGGLSVDKIAVNEVTNKFGYRNVIFGNYVNDKERKESLNHFLGAMLDLHEMMDMDVVEINKLGGLDINFGSTGCGAFSLAMACYMPQLKAINLTKKRGDGCIAHEWSHYLDNVLGEGTERKATKQTYATQLGSYLNNSDRIKYVFMEFVNWLNSGGEERTIMVEFAATKKTRFSLYGTTVETAVAEIQKKREYYTHYKNVSDAAVIRYYGYIAHKLNDNKPIMVPMKTKQSWYMQQSSAFGGPDYWANPKELFARAFEWYIEDALKLKKRTNSYLVNTANSLGLLYMLIPFDQHPYPRKEQDIEWLRGWFKKLFSDIRMEFSIKPFSWNSTARVDEFLDYSDEQKNDLINTGLKVSSSGKIQVVGDDIEPGEKGYSFKRDIVSSKQVYTILLNGSSINKYISKLDGKEWSIYAKNDVGNKTVIALKPTIEEAKKYVVENNLLKEESETNIIDPTMEEIPTVETVKSKISFPEAWDRLVVYNNPSYANEAFYIINDAIYKNQEDWTRMTKEPSDKNLFGYGLLGRIVGLGKKKYGEISLYAPLNDLIYANADQTRAFSDAITYKKLSLMFDDKLAELYFKNGMRQFKNGNYIQAGFNSQKGKYVVIYRLASELGQAKVNASDPFEYDFEHLALQKINELIEQNKTVEPIKSPVQIKNNNNVSSTATMDLNKPTNWNQLPESWKVVKKVPSIAIDNSPYDKNLQKLIEPFLVTDALRPVFQGAKFDKDGITATDAHKLIHLPYPNKEFNGIYRTSSKIKIDVNYLKGDIIEGKYPEYQNVLPQAINVYRISVLKLKTFISAISAGNFYNETTKQIILNGDKNKDGEIMQYAYNSQFLMQILNSCLLLGKEYVYFGVSLPNKALIICFTELAAKDPKDYLGKEVVMLQMPVLIEEPNKFENGMVGGAIEPDFEKEFKIAYSLPDDNIYNYDGSIVDFDFNLTKAQNTDLTPQQTKIVNAFKPNNSFIIPIMEGVLISGKKVYVTDLESTVIINGIDKPKDVYYFLNDAFVVYNPKANAADEFPKMDTKESEYKSLGSINRLELLFNIEKANLCVGKDELRPQFSGIHFTKKADSDELVIESTNAHVLFRNEIKIHSVDGHVDMIVPATKKLKVFLENIFDEDVQLLISGTNVMFKTSEATVISRLIDAKYPNVVAVIPRYSEKTFTLDISNLKNCMKTITKEEIKKEAIMVFGNVENGLIKVDLHHMVEQGPREAHKSEFLRQLCEVKASVSNESRDNKLFVFLGMPAMVGKDNEQDKHIFALKPDILETFIKISESDKLVIDYNSPNKALVLSESEFKEISKPVNVPQPSKKAVKVKDEIETIAEKQDTADKKSKSVKSLKKVVVQDARDRKLKLVSAKAKAQSQRIRILELEKPKLKRGGPISGYKRVQFKDKSELIAEPIYYVIREEGDNYVAVIDEKMQLWERSGKADREAYYEEILSKDEVEEVMKAGGKLAELDTIETLIKSEIKKHKDDKDYDSFNDDSGSIIIKKLENDFNYDWEYDSKAQQFFLKATPEEIWQYYLDVIIAKIRKQQNK